MAGLRASILSACLLSACCQLAPPSSPMPTASGSPPAATPEPFVGTVDDALAHAPELLGRAATVTGTIDWVAEGGPSFVLTMERGEPGIVVLVLDEPADGLQTFRNHEGATAVVAGTFYDLTPENVDRADIPTVEGHAFVHVFDGSGNRYLVVGRVTSVR